MNNRQRSEQRTPQRDVVIHTSENMYDVDPSLIPDGMSYEFKRKSSFGQEDRRHQVMTFRNHWTTVPASRHPELISDVAGEEIEVGGLVLCERPKYITDKSRDMEDFRAANLVATQMQKVHSQAKAVSRKLDGVKRSAPEPIPDDGV